MVIKRNTPELLVGPRRNQKGNKKYLETTVTGNTTHQNSWDTVKAILKGSL